MLFSWFAALIQTYILIEPVQILALACCPVFVNENTCIGRCCFRIRFVYNEIFAP